MICKKSLIVTALLITLTTIGMAQATGNRSTLDEVGGATGATFSPDKAIGNAFRIDTDVVLKEFEFHIAVFGSVPLNFYVYESTAEFGTYDQVFTFSTMSGTGPGKEWASSGPLALPLQAGNYYIMAVSWEGTAGWLYDPGDTQPTSFGAQVHGFGPDTNPLPATISSMTNNEVIYNQRITTEKPVIEEVGGESGATFSPDMAVGNAFRIDTDVILKEFEFNLGVFGSVPLTFYVYESTVEFGTYEQVFTSSTMSGAGPGKEWASSGPLFLPLQAGNYYIMAISWEGTAGYLYDPGDMQAISFGAQVHGFGPDTNPLPATISSMTNNEIIYHQRVTTEASSLLAISPGSISAQAGGTANFALDAGAAMNGGRNYFILGTMSGTSPGTPVGGVVLPLNWDTSTDVFLMLTNTAALVDFNGTLNGSGVGAAQLDTMGPLPSSLVGSVFHFAFLLYSPIDFVSNPVALEIVP